MNFLIGIGMLLASLVFGFAFPVAGGVGAILLGAWNLYEAYRRRIKTLITYVMCGAAVYVGGHLLIAYYWPYRFSGAAAIWTIAFPAMCTLLVWMRGGNWLDLTILITRLSDDEFTRLMAALDGGQVTVTSAVIPGIHHPVQRTLYYLNTAVSYPRGVLLFLLPIWRNLGNKLFQVLEDAALVSFLFGMYFMFFPPSYNWNLFGFVAVSFGAYCFTGIKINKPLWRKVATWGCIIGIVGSQVTHFSGSVSMPHLTGRTLLLVGPALIVLALIVNMLFSNNHSPASAKQGGTHE